MVTNGGNAMNQNDPETLTHQEMLVVWGQFVHSLGLIAH
jgi:hypothetical protein